MGVQIIHKGQHLLKHRATDISYINPSFPAFKTVQGALNQLFNTLGSSLTWQLPVETHDDLPTSGNLVNDARVVQDDGDGKPAIYVCVATVGTIDQQWQKLADVDWGTPTLDIAYDSSGSGLGRTIIADSGSVEILVPNNAGNSALYLENHDVTNHPITLEIEDTTNGNTIEINKSVNTSSNVNTVYIDVSNAGSGHPIALNVVSGDVWVQGGKVSLGNDSDLEPLSPYYKQYHIQDQVDDFSLHDGYFHIRAKSKMNPDTDMSGVNAHYLTAYSFVQEFVEGSDGDIEYNESVRIDMEIEETSTVGLLGGYALSVNASHLGTADCNYFAGGYIYSVNINSATIQNNIGLTIFAGNSGVLGTGHIVTNYGLQIEDPNFFNGGVNTIVDTNYGLWINNQDIGATIASWAIYTGGGNVEFHNVSGKLFKHFYSSSDVLHGMTTIVPTNVYGLISPLVDSTGGLKVMGVSDGDAAALELTGILGMASVTSTTPTITLKGQKKSGTGVQNLGAGDCLLRVLNNASSTPSMWITGGNLVGLGTATPSAQLHVVETAVTSGAISALKVVSSVNTGQTASTEINGVLFDLSATRTWATGNIATQREFRITAPTYAFAGASQIDNAYGVYISGAPIEGTNATIVNTHALFIAQGNVGTADNSFGLIVNGQTGATNNYAAVFLNGNVGINTLTPTAHLDISGDLKVNGRASFGNQASFFDGNVVNLLMELTDFSATTYWPVFAYFPTINPAIDIAGTDITVFDFETFVPDTNTKNISSITNFYYYSNIGGSGHLTLLINAQNGSILNGTRTCDENYAYLVQSGHFGTGGNIGEDITIEIQTPANGNGGTMDEHIGLMISNQEFGTESWAIYCDGGRNFFKGNVGIGSGKDDPAEALDVNGNILGSNGIAIGANAPLGLVSTVLRRYSFGDTFTDFTGVGEAHLVSFVLELNPSADIVNQYIYGQTFDIDVQAGNTKNVSFLQAVTMAVSVSGSGIIDYMAGGSITATHNGTGLVAEQNGLFVTSNSVNTGDITTNLGLWIQSGTSHASSAITTNKTLVVSTPNSVGTITTNIGLHIEDQAFGTNSWAIKTDGGKVEFGAVTTKSSLFYMSNDDVAHALTSIVPTRVYVEMKPVSATTGGFSLRGFNEVDTPAMFIGGYCGDDGVISGPVVVFDAAQNDGGGGLSSFISGATIMYSFRNNGNSVLDITCDGTSGSFVFRNPNYANPITDLLPSDSYSIISAYDSADGGLQILSSSDADGIPGLDIIAIMGDTTITQPVITIRGAKRGGTNRADLGSTEIILDIINNNNDLTPAVRVFGSNNVLFGGTISVPGAGTLSERFGALTTAAGNNSVAVGNGAVATGNDGTVIGQAATSVGTDTIVIGQNAVANTGANQSVLIGNDIATGSSEGVAIGFGVSNNTATVSIGRGANGGNNGVGIGRFAGAGGTGCVMIGSGAIGTGTNNIGIGRDAAVTGSGGATNSIGIGANVVTGFDQVICIGGTSVASAANQLLLGGSTTSITNVFIGKGVTSATPSTVTIQATGGNGAGIAGADIVFAGGMGGTSADAGGNILFKTAIAGAGTTLVTRLTISPSGAATFTGTNPASGSGNGIIISPTLGIMNGSDTYNALNVDITNANHTGSSNEVRGIYIDGITFDADATATAIKVGSGGWNYGISLATNLGVAFGDANNYNIVYGGSSLDFIGGVVTFDGGVIASNGFSVPGAFFNVDDTGSMSAESLDLNNYLNLNSARLNQSQGADVASANDLVLGFDGNTFEIRGNTQINAIDGGGSQNGTEIILLFTSNPTVKHNTAGGAGTLPVLLAGAADFSATAGDVLTLVLCEIGGTQAWRETGRTAI